MTAVCPGCSVTEGGYSVLFPEASDSRFLDRYMAQIPASEWKRFGGGRVWLKEKPFYEMLDYALAHLQDTGILAAPSAKQDAPVEQVLMLPLEHFLAHREAHWIDDVIRHAAIQTQFQPIVRAEGNVIRTAGYELLSRGVDEQGGLIPPNRLFEAARVRNRLFALDRVCRLEAVRQASGLQDALVFINFLPTSIYNPEHCLQSTFQMVRQSGLEPSNIVFEVVESEEIKNMDHLRTILEYYKKHGFRFALDDVGTGYNSLQVLAELKPEVVKLAIEYTRGVSNDPDKYRVAQAVLDMTRGMGSQALAEGVENREDYEVLLAMGYDLFQGYYFGKPGPKPVGYGGAGLVAEQVK
ncbi:EAL domain-containing protein [Paenibacillus gansuensis]|uniref:EAL domain-containing protein n=1 Tax=Paenibacillus gansuensis TaxID=306542 RepID=A0ABW5PJD8_9BACL